MAQPRKTSQIQIRVTPAQKAELTRKARAAGMDLSAWMLERLVPGKGVRFRALASDLAKGPYRAHVFAELHDLLAGLGRAEFASVVDTVPLSALGALEANQLAAMVETAGARLGVKPPAWVDAVPPLQSPWFSTELSSLRLHLLCSSPPMFRRRNLFVDSTLGDRV